MADRKLLRELTEAFGPSGFEGEPASIMIRELGKTGEVTRDGLGSVISRIVGGSDGPRIMVSAHIAPGASDIYVPFDITNTIGVEYLKIQVRTKSIWRMLPSMFSIA